MNSFIADSSQAARLLSDTLRVLVIQPEHNFSTLEFISPIIALLAVIFGPLITLHLGKRQNIIQMGIAEKQISTQTEIARGQIST